MLWLKIVTGNLEEKEIVKLKKTKVSERDSEVCS